MHWIRCAGSWLMSVMVVYAGSSAVQDLCEMYTVQLAVHVMAPQCGVVLIYRYSTAHGCGGLGLLITTLPSFS